MLRGAAALFVVAAIAGLAPAGASARTDVALEWYDHTASAVAAAAVPVQSTNSRTWAVAWLSALRALNAHGSADAAVATAVHDALAAQLPGQAATLDAALEATLARLPDRPSTRAGVRAGREAARRTLAEREGDGLDPASVNAPFAPPPPAPGVWQLTPPAFAPAIGAGLGRARPFLLGDASRFRPPPPPALGTPAYRRELDEVRRLGSATSTERTQAQTDLARFWAQGSLGAYTTVLRAALQQGPRSPRWRAALVAAFHIASVDTQIAGFEAKYHYQRWRPVTAIRPDDPDWLPLIVTPAHPDYPSGHNIFAGAAEGVLEAFAGSGPREPFELISPTLPGAVRTYRSWEQLTRENVDARVWSGIHFRSADVAGVELGRAVARHDLLRLARLAS